MIGLKLRPLKTLLPSRCFLSGVDICFIRTGGQRLDLFKNDGVEDFLHAPKGAGDDRTVHHPMIVHNSYGKMPVPAHDTIVEQRSKR